MKARLALTAAVCAMLCACAGPSLRYRQDVNDLFARGEFEAAEAKIRQNRNKVYGKNNEALFLLDLSQAQSAARRNEESSRSLAAAQDKIDELFAVSITQTLGTLIINDNTQPYRPPPYEQALTHFFRAMDYLSLDNLSSAGVEARRAVFFLDNLRSHKRSGYNDDPFIQFFASMIFEDMGNMSSARIARANARNAYEAQAGWHVARPPDFQPPQGHRDMGEAVIFHFNGRAPLKISKEIMFAWNDIWFAVQGNSDLHGVSGDVINAVYAGAFGNSITISFPEFTDSQYIIESSTVSVVAQDGQQQRTQFVADIASQARQALREDLTMNQVRMITRAVTKYILSVQARNLVKKQTGNQTAGALTGMIFSVFSNVTERADTRSWFTLPAEIRMANLFLEPGVYDIKITFFNRENAPVDEYLFEKVQINKGRRTYLYRRTAR